MAPADPKDWLLAVTALTTATVSPALANDAPKAGVITGAVSSTRQGQATDTQSVVLGDTVRPGEQFKTGPAGIIHILFLDQSSVTIGPNSQMTLDSFSHDAASRSGKIIMTLNEGSLRVVGGINSKTNATEVRTPSATVEILGGISTIQHQGQTTQATFLFGTSMQVSGNGVTQSVTRPGFGVSSGEQGVSPPKAASPNQLSLTMKNFEANGPTGGSQPSSSSTPPTPPPPSSGSTTLISTSDRPGGQGNATTTLASDRLGNSNSGLVGGGMSQSRNDSTLSGSAPAPVTTVRTPPLPVTAS